MNSSMVEQRFVKPLVESSNLSSSACGGHSPQENVVLADMVVCIRLQTGRKKFESFARLRLFFEKSECDEDGES